MRRLADQLVQRDRVAEEEQHVAVLTTVLRKDSEASVVTVFPGSSLPQRPRSRRKNCSFPDTCAYPTLLSEPNFLAPSKRSDRAGQIGVLGSFRLSLG